MDSHPKKAFKTLLVLLFVMVGLAVPLLSELSKTYHLEGIARRLLELGWFAYIYGWVYTLHRKHLKD